MFWRGPPPGYDFTVVLFIVYDFVVLRWSQRSPRDYEQTFIRNQVSTVARQSKRRF